MPAGLQRGAGGWGAQPDTAAPIFHPMCGLTLQLQPRSQGWGEETQKPHVWGPAAAGMKCQLCLIFGLRFCTNYLISLSLHFLAYKLRKLLWIV